MALQERQRLSALEVERRATLRGHEAEMAAEQARLDDRAKEQRLAQVAIVEQSYQKQLQVDFAPQKWQSWESGDHCGVQLAEAVQRWVICAGSAPMLILGPMKCTAWASTQAAQSVRHLPRPTTTGPFGYYMVPCADRCFKTEQVVDCRRCGRNGLLS